MGTAKVFSWKGKDIATHGDVMRALLRLENKEEAQKFLNLYRSSNQYADQNVGYCLGYFLAEDRHRIEQMLPSISHPLFGRDY